MIQTNWNRLYFIPGQENSRALAQIQELPCPCRKNQSMDDQPYGLRPTLTRGAGVETLAADAWRLSIPAGPGRRYRLSQLDNYNGLTRRSFPHQPALRVRLQARASGASLPGTWGFGLWNDPFAMGALAGQGLRLPVLPNTAWFFFASAENYLSFRDDLPACGGLAAVFQSPAWPPVLLAMAAPGLPFLIIPPIARQLRRLASRFIRQDGVSLQADPNQWRTYQIDWQPDLTRFQVDGQTVLQSRISPRGPLGLVIWIDNQFAAFRPDGRLSYGMLPNPTESWIEIRSLCLDSNA